ncbi:hypothetical protein IU402_02115 [Aerococcaceae bacterium zg-BR9]|uniref:hypothetical protein n=1 Tax=Aerococcaceae bacterium zg-1292 TaxID=2774330 RepID=UPI004064297E|nr:hypothetical protein [Aerococcaceae bacterium zg-BR9]
MSQLKENRWLLLILFVYDIVINYLISMGILFPHSQREISDKYLNLLAPAGITFSIWSVIYFSVAILIVYELKSRKEDAFFTVFKEQIKPLYFQWILYNIIWNILWSFDLVLPALIAIALYANTLIRITRMISQHTRLRQRPWLLKYPVGIHTGWIIFATIANLTTYTAAIGSNQTTHLAMYWTLATILVGLLFLLYLYVHYGNPAIFLTGIWAVLGVYLKHNDGTFVLANQFIKRFALVIVVLSLALFMYIQYLQMKSNKAD